MTDVSVAGRVKGLPARTTRKVVRAVLSGERREAAVTVTWIGAVAMRRLNAKHMKHDYPTDVLSFALPLPDGRLAGDIYICPAEALKNAGSLGVRPREELIRLLVHGMLHVLGYDHPEARGRERSPMWRRQEKYMKKLLGA